MFGGKWVSGKAGHPYFFKGSVSDIDVCGSLCEFEYLHFLALLTPPHCLPASHRATFSLHCLARSQPQSREVRDEHREAALHPHRRHLTQALHHLGTERERLSTARCVCVCVFFLSFSFSVYTFSHARVCVCAFSLSASWLLLAPCSYSGPASTMFVVLALIGTFSHGQPSLASMS